MDVAARRWWSIGLVASMSGGLVACGASTPSGDGTTGDGTTGSTTSGPGLTDATTTPGPTTSGATGVDDTSDASTGAPPVDPVVAPVKVMTFNVLCEICDPTYDPWVDRLGYIADTIARHDPDLVGLQELMNAENVEQIVAGSPDYTPVAFVEQGDVGDYPDATILVRTERFEVVDHGFYWLSPTPDTPMSTGFADGFQLPRLVVWAELLDDDGASLLLIDTHFDNNSPSQELSAPLVVERTTEPAAMLPTILVGDSNSQPSDLAYEILTGASDPGPFAFTDAFELAGAFTQLDNGDPPAWDPDQRIDHIFVGPRAWTATDWTVDTWRYGRSNNFASDHFAIVATLELPPAR